MAKRFQSHRAPKARTAVTGKRFKSKRTEPITKATWHSRYSEPTKKHPQVIDYLNSTEDQVQYKDKPHLQRDTNKNFGGRTRYAEVYNATSTEPKMTDGRGPVNRPYEPGEMSNELSSSPGMQAARINIDTARKEKNLEHARRDAAAQVAPNPKYSSGTIVPSTTQAPPDPAKQAKDAKMRAGGNKALDAVSKIGNAVGTAANMTGAISDIAHTGAKTILNPSPLGLKEGQYLADAAKKTGDLATKVMDRGVEQVDKNKSKKEQELFEQTKKEALYNIPDANGNLGTITDPKQLTIEQRKQYEDNMAPAFERIKSLNADLAGTNTSQTLAGAASEFHKEQKEGAEQAVKDAELERDKTKLGKDEAESTKDKMGRASRAAFDAEIEYLQKVSNPQILSDNEKALLDQVRTLGSDAVYDELTNRVDFDLSNPQHSFAEAFGQTPMDDTAVNSSINALIAKKVQGTATPQDLKRLAQLAEIKESRGMQLSNEEYDAKVNAYHEEYVKPTLGDSSIARAVSRQLATNKDLIDKLKETGDLYSVLIDPKLSKMFNSVAYTSSQAANKVLKNISSDFFNYESQMHVWASRGEGLPAWSTETTIDALKLLKDKTPAEIRSTLSAYNANNSATSHMLTQDNLNKLADIKEKMIAKNQSITDDQINAYIKEKNTQNICLMMGITRDLEKDIIDAKKKVTIIAEAPEVVQARGYKRGKQETVSEDEKAAALDILRKHTLDAVMVTQNGAFNDYFSFEPKENVHNTSADPYSNYVRLVNSLVPKFGINGADYDLVGNDDGEVQIPMNDMAMSASLALAKYDKIISLNEQINSTVDPAGYNPQRIDAITDLLNYGSAGGTTYNKAIADSAYEVAWRSYNNIPDSAATKPQKAKLYAAMTGYSIKQVFGDDILDYKRGDPKTGIVGKAYMRLSTDKEKDNFFKNFGYTIDPKNKDPNRYDRALEEVYFQAHALSQVLLNQPGLGVSRIDPASKKMMGAINPKLNPAKTQKFLNGLRLIQGQTLS